MKLECLVLFLDVKKFFKNKMSAYEELNVNMDTHTYTHTHTHTQRMTHSTGATSLLLAAKLVTRLNISNSF